MTDIQKVRLNIGDRNAEIFTDEEIQSFIDDEGGSINGATAKALEIMSVMSGMGGLIKTSSIGEISVNKITLLELAQYYRQRQTEEASKISFFVAPRGDGL